MKMMTAATTLFLLSITTVAALRVPFLKRSSTAKGSSTPKDPICSHPGDPSLILTTNVDLGGPEAKLDIMKKCSKLISEVTGKPEQYVAVSITDGASVIWGGETCNAALGCFYCIGQINKENNGAIQAGVSSLLKPHGVEDDKIYINYFDVPRENCGWSSRTFAG
mmetsp:Transcript_18362/g.38228  ORF Transcript_18362/g.38228 Transcript_18362/m.38228 type:complete len:165 (-) Transcript_18362:115-609(-)